ncbi:MAG: HlyC/CorC family transporter [Acidobacteria bacterium]|nr:HlyC/CorC family transporter [Acidobacteriota bacterium]
MWLLTYIFAIVALAAGLTVFAYLDRVYRELGRVTTGSVHTHLDIFEAEIEPRLKMDRRRGGVTFNLISNLWLVLCAVGTARGVTFFASGTIESIGQHFLLLTGEVVLGILLIPYVLMTRTTGRWLTPLIPVVRIFVWLVAPLRVLYEVAISLVHLGESEDAGPHQATQQGIEQLVEAAAEEGILKSEQAHLIEQVVEFTDKRVRDVMTPRPDIVAIQSKATVEELRRLLVESKFSRIPVYKEKLDDIVGIAHARDVLQVPEKDSARRTVSELARPALFVPETKQGSHLLKELQQKKQQIAIAINEYGNVAGLVTIEDLIEEIVGEIEDEGRAPAPDAVRQPDGSVILRGSVQLGTINDIFGIELKVENESPATTISGLLNQVAGHVPVPGEIIDWDLLRFEVLEANQRKVLRLRARTRPESAALAADTT